MTSLNTVVVIAAMAVLGNVQGCFKKEPKAITLYNDAYKLELVGKKAEAIEKFAESAAQGNASAYQKIGELRLTADFIRLAPKNRADYVHGYDQWIIDAKDCIASARENLQRARIAGCTNSFERIEALAKSCETMVSDVEKKVENAKMLEEIRQAQIRKQKEEEARAAKEREIKMAEEANRRREEENRRNDPEYCIEHDYVMPAPAFREVVKAVTYVADTGNEITDAEENRRHWNRFRGKRIKVNGRIRKVETTFFTDKVKCIIDAHGHSISARFDSMSKSEGANLKIGRVITIEGKISDRLVLSEIAMDDCRIE